MMIQTKQLVSNPAYNPDKPKDIGNQPLKWAFGHRALQVGDHVEFTCNGRGRGGHDRVFAKVTKINEKTFTATEWNRSYAPGTLWTVDVRREQEYGGGGVIIDLSWKD